MKKLPVVGTRESCTCTECISACTNKPGWFAPGEPEKAAKLMKMSLPNFFKKFLGVDFWENTGSETFVLAPATTTMEPGGEYPYQPTGRCVFLTRNGRCRIHAAKPKECAAAKPKECASMLHGEGSHKPLKEAIAKSWKKNLPQIKSLLGRDPCAPEDDGSIESPMAKFLGAKLFWPFGR